jgi:hypothetical protein
MPLQSLKLMKLLEWSSNFKLSTMGTLRSIVGLGLRSSTSGLTDTNIYEKGIAIQQNGRMALGVPIVTSH